MRYKVVLLPFPFDDLSGTKVRPAVCLTDFIGAYRHLIVAFITSQMPPDAVASDMLLDVASPEFGSTGLKVTSTLRLHRLMTVTPSLIRRELGILSPATQLEVKSKLSSLLL